MKQKHQKDLFHLIGNANLMVENVIQIKSGTKVNADVGAKIQQNIIFAKKNTFAIVVNVPVKFIDIDI